MQFMRRANTHPLMLAPWPQFTLQTKQVLQLMRDNITAIPDGTLSGRYYRATNLRVFLDFNLQKTEFADSMHVLNEFQK